MELRQESVKKVIISTEVNERTYEVHCSMDAPLGELHDVLLAIKGNIVKRLSEAQSQEQETADFVNGKTDVLPGQQPQQEETQPEETKVDEAQVVEVPAEPEAPVAEEAPKEE